MANGNPKKWSTEVDKANKPNEEPKLPGVLGTNQTSGVLDSTDPNWFDKFKSNLGNFFSPKAPDDPYWNPITKTRGISPYYEGDISGIQDSTWSDAQKMAMAVKNAMSQNEGDIKPSNYYWGDQFGFQEGNRARSRTWVTFGRNDPDWFNPETDSMTVKDGRYTYKENNPMTDAQKMAFAGDPYYGIGKGPLDYSKIGPGGIEDKKVSGPASTLETLQPGEPGAIADLTATTTPEDFQNESGGIQWADAFQSLQAQFADPSVTKIDLPVVLNADGSLADFEMPQKSTQQVVDPDTGKLTTLTSTKSVPNPKYQALQDYAKNAQEQKNFQAQQDQQVYIQQLSMFPQILDMLTTPGVADVLRLMGGGGVDPLFQPVFGQGFGLPSTVQDTFLSPEQGGEVDMMSTLPSSVQPAMQQRQYLPTESYIQRLGPDALEGLKGLMGFMGHTPYDLQRMAGSVTPQFSGILPGGGAPGRATGVR